MLGLGQRLLGPLAEARGDQKVTGLGQRVDRVTGGGGRLLGGWGEGADDREGCRQGRGGSSRARALPEDIAPRAAPHHTTSASRSRRSRRVSDQGVRIERRQAQTLVEGTRRRRGVESGATTPALPRSVRQIVGGDSIDPTLRARPACQGIDDHNASFAA